MSRSATWYFDFISPFAYLQFRQFDRLPGDLEVTLCPVLFAGLLGHWEHKGPAEIPAKRVQTYRYVEWLGRRLGIPLRTPPAHPFNPIRVLRLAIALDSSREAVATIFDYIWGEGGDCHNDAGFDALCARLGVADAHKRISAPAIKTALRSNTDGALTAGVYGVPTFAIDGELFWGSDTTDMFLDYLEDPSLLDTPDMQRLRDLPSAAVRKA